MGRILFFLFVLVVILLVYIIANDYILYNNHNRNKHKVDKEENRKSFKEDIEAVAREIKKRKK